MQLTWTRDLLFYTNFLFNKHKAHQSVIDAMCAYLQKPGGQPVGTHPGGQNTIGTTETGRQHAAAFFNCLPEEESTIINCPVLINSYLHLIYLLNVNPISHNCFLNS